MDQSQKRRHRPDTRAADVDESHWRRRSSARQTSRKSSVVKGQGREHLPSTSRRASFPDKQDDPPMRSVSRFESVPNERADSRPHQRSNAEDGAVERETNDVGGAPSLGINGRHASISPSKERVKGSSVTERATRLERDDRDSTSDNSITESQQGVSARGSRREDDNQAARTTNSFASGRGSLADGHLFRESVGGRGYHSSDSDPRPRSNSISVDRKDSLPPHGSPKRRERYAPGNPAMTNRGSSNFHSDIVDDDLMISNSKLDNALIQMFSPQPSRNPTGHSFAAAAAAKSLGPDRPDDISMAPVMWRVHPMEAVQRETLDRETSFLADHLIPRDMIGDLYRQNVLTSADYHQLSRMEGQGDRAVTRLMIKTLQRRGRNAYPAFLNVLRQHGLHNVCERLLESERSLKYGIQQDRSTYERIKDWVNLETVHQNGMHNSYSFNRRYSPLSTDYNPSPMFQPSQMVSGYNFPFAFPMSLNLPVTPPTYPLVANHDGSFSIRVTTTPPPREPIVFSQLETQLEFMRKELKALHHDVHDMKSVLRNSDVNGPSSTPDTPRRPGKNDRTVVMYDNPGHSSRAHSPAVGDLGSYSPPPDSTRPVQGLDGSPMPGEGEKSYKIIEAEGLTKHLGELHAEVKALHDDVTALTTARSRKDRRSSQLFPIPNAQTPDDDGSQISMSQTSSTPREFHRHEAVPFNDTPVKDLDHTRRITHRDYDPLPNPSPRSLVTQRSNSLGGDGRDSVAAPSPNQSLKTTSLPSRKTHESFDPLPRVDKTGWYRIPSRYSVPAGLNDVHSSNPALPDNRSSKKQVTVKEYSTASPPSIAAIKQKVRDETTGYYGVDPPPQPGDAASKGADTKTKSRNSKPMTSAAPGKNLRGSDVSFRGQDGIFTSESQPATETRGNVLGRSVEDLQGRVRELAEEIATLKAQKHGQSATPSGPHATPTDHDSHARRLEEQLEELHAQLRRLRHDVTDLKTEENQHINKTTTEMKGILKQTKNTTSPQYLSPKPQPSPTHQSRPVTKQESREKVKEADDRRKSSDLLHPEGPKSPASDRRTSNDSSRAPSTNGSRITSDSRVLSPPSDRETRARRITSPLTVLPDQSLPWPESTRVKVAT